ncbi:hypothetical protein RHGRI_035364 [Rhododendron griersonianum]|uniref:Disease resistance N-terminal domain-containing protein n=1 Tax=Rhododendron griersonianum TaxID=479676 RepID=A0AAV6I7N4_9ERIC|nr:hypothetical protein RHGRI_035362 [Rhododendron griersonianum]KAG5523532.1 hypothetical protein RHGRI_035364 [Rhododendron griersonianum]
MVDDTAVDIFLETLKQLLTSSKLGLIIDEKRQLQFLDENIKYLRGFLKITEKNRKEHAEVMELVTRIRDVVLEAENIVELYVVYAFKTDASCSLQENRDHLFLDIESVKKEIETLTVKVKQIYDLKTYENDGGAAKKHRHSSTKSGSIGTYFQYFKLQI